MVFICQFLAYIKYDNRNCPYSIELDSKLTDLEAVDRCNDLHDCGGYQRNIDGTKIQLFSLEYDGDNCNEISTWTANVKQSGGILIFLYRIKTIFI